MLLEFDSKCKENLANLRESDKLLKDKLGSFQGSCLFPMSFWLCANILVSKGADNPFYKNIVTEFNDKDFSENSIKVLKTFMN